MAHNTMAGLLRMPQEVYGAADRLHQATTGYGITGTPATAHAPRDGELGGYNALPDTLNVAGTLPMGGLLSAGVRGGESVGMAGGKLTHGGNGPQMSVEPFDLTKRIAANAKNDPATAIEQPIRDAILRGATNRQIIDAAEPLIEKLRDQYGVAIMNSNSKDPAVFGQWLLNLHKGVTSEPMPPTRPFTTFGAYADHPELARFNDAYGDNSGLGIPYAAGPDEISALYRKTMADYNAETELRRTENVRSTSANNMELPRPVEVQSRSFNDARLLDDPSVRFSDNDLFTNPGDKSTVGVFGALTSEHGGPQMSTGAVPDGPSQLTQHPKNVNIKNKHEVGFAPIRLRERPFSDDYKNALEGARGSILTHDIDGRPLTAPYVAGRRTFGGANEPLSPDDISGLLGRLGIQSHSAPEGRVDPGRPGAVGSALTFDSGGVAKRQIRHLDTLTDSERNLVIPHELGHHIDDMTGNAPISPSGSRGASEVYHELSAGTDFPRHGHATPEDFGYPPSEAPSEIMAEAFRAYLTNPNYIKTTSPVLAKELRRIVNDHPEMSQHLQLNGNPATAAPMAGLTQDQSKRAALIAALQAAGE